MGKLDGKVAVITGATSGMALAGAKLFVDEGAHVFISGRRQDALDEAVEQIGRNVTGVQADSADLADLDRLFETVKAGKGHGRRVVGKCRGGRAGQARRDHRGAVRCRFLGERARHAVHGPEGAAAVQRRRLDLHDRVKRLASRLPQLERVRSEQGRAARLRTGVGVRAERQEDPGERADPRPGRHGDDGQVLTAEMKEQFESVIPRREMGRPEEIASVALFLASDDSSYVNGMELVVDGGTTVI